MRLVIDASGALQIECIATFVHDLLFLLFLHPSLFQSVCQTSAASASGIKLTRQKSAFVTISHSAPTGCVQPTRLRAACEGGHC